MSISETRFGFREIATINTGTARIGAVSQVNQYDLYISSNKSSCIYEGTKLKTDFKRPATTSIYIPEHQMVFLVSPKSDILSVFSLKDPRKQVFDQFHINQFDVIHMRFEKTTSTLFTIGTKVKVWKIDFLYPETVFASTIPGIKVTFIKDAITNYISQILNDPYLQEEKKLLFIYQNELLGFDTKGNVSKRLCQNDITAFAVNGDTIATANSNGFIRIFEHYSERASFNVGKSLIESIKFIDDENILIINCRPAVYIGNINTLQAYQVSSLPSLPMRVFPLGDKKFAFSYQGKLSIYQATTVWSTWIMSVLRPSTMQMVHGILTVVGSDSFVKLIDGNGKVLSIASSASTDQVKSIALNEYLYMVMDSGQVLVMDISETPATEIGTLNLPMIDLIKVIDNGNHYLLSTKKGEILLCSKDFVIEQRVQIDTRSLNLFEDDDSYIAVTNNELVFIDKQWFRMSQKKPANAPNVSDFHNHKVYYGMKNGNIRIYDLAKNCVDEDHAHSAPVTGFSFAPKFWVSVSDDGSCIVWNYFDDVSQLICFPCPLTSCSVLKNDILVGVENAIMMVKDQVPPELRTRPAIPKPPMSQNEEQQPIKTPEKLDIPSPRRYARKAQTARTYIPTFDPERAEIERRKAMRELMKLDQVIGQSSTAFGEESIKTIEPPKVVSTPPPRRKRKALSAKRPTRVRDTLDILHELDPSIPRRKTETPQRKESISKMYTVDIFELARLRDTTEPITKPEENPTAVDEKHDTETPIEEIKPVQEIRSTVHEEIEQGIEENVEQSIDEKINDQSIEHVSEENIDQQNEQKAEHVDEESIDHQNEQMIDQLIDEKAEHLNEDNIEQIIINDEKAEQKVEEIIPKPLLDEEVVDRPNPQEIEHPSDDFVIHRIEDEKDTQLQKEEVKEMFDIPSPKRIQPIEPPKKIDNARSPLRSPKRVTQESAPELPLLVISSKSKDGFTVRTSLDANSLQNEIQAKPTVVRPIKKRVNQSEVWSPRRSPLPDFQ